MARLEWRTLELDKGVYREPTPDASRIILWLPGKVDNGFQYWERLTNIPGAEIVEEQGICFTQATSMPARQKMRGFIGRLFSRLRKPAANTAWLLPTGGFAEQLEERQTGLLLAWAEAESGTLDEERLKARWAEGQHFRKVGKNVFLVSPPQSGFTTTESAPPLLGNPREQAEQLLASARLSGDRGAQAVALTDLGSALVRGGDSVRALVILEEAAQLGRQLEDRSMENDALGILGMAFQAAGQPGRALEVLGQALAYARETGDRFREKSILANLGIVLAGKRDFSEALVTTDHALALARELGDRSHEADLLWFQAVQHAELAHDEVASKLAQEAIDVHATLRSPHVGWLTSHLKRFRPITLQTITPSSGASPGGYYTGPTVAVAPTPTAPAPPCDPGVLRTALSAVKTMEKSAGSGMKTVAQAIFQQRLETCATCPHHTGMRCKLCDSFTSAKAWLPHERCPAGKWAK